MEQELNEEVVEEVEFELVVSSLVFAFGTDPTGFERKGGEASFSNTGLRYNSPKSA